MVNHIKHNLKQTDENIILRSGQSISFTLPEIPKQSDYRFFFSAEDTSGTTLKSEAGAELLYMLIDDSLDYENAEKDRYCLDFSCKKPLPFAKRALKKVLWQPLCYGLFDYKWAAKEYSENYRCGIFAKADNLKITKNGYLHLRIDVWNIREDVNPSDTIAPPDSTYTVEMSEGSYGYTDFGKDLILSKENTACVLVTIEGMGYCGNVYFERPYLCDIYNHNMLFEFDRSPIGVEKTAWVGQNLSKREWPHFELSVNGNTVFDGEQFLKVHRFSPIEIVIPENSLNESNNTIELKYKSSHIDAVPVRIDEVYLVETPKFDFRVLNLPDAVPIDKETRLLVETKGNVKNIGFESDDFELCGKWDYDEVNLAVLSVRPKRQVNGLSFTLRYEDSQKNYTVSRCIIKTDDNVISGSGDMIYIDISDFDKVFDYLKWFVENDIGNLLTIRQVYRWGGQRFVNSEIWSLFTDICDKMDISYVLISDGRDIPSLAANPKQKMLSGKNFLGSQLHERDGQLFYWARDNGHPVEIEAPCEEFYDLAARLGREESETIEGSFRPFNIEYSEDGYSFRRNFVKNRDVFEAKTTVGEELKNLSSGGFIRHTGPSVMFKYYYENGFEWCGAETMDGATEILLSFLRGASKAYKKEKYGVHLALQWSTYPHNTVQRFRRYLLSLYVPYMHGITDINTEEGLWFMESFYSHHNRLSDACIEHRKVLNCFNKFVRTHSRTGKFHTPIAVLHGNMDGWNGFNSPFEWGMPSLELGDSGASWQIMKAFYPLNAIEDYGCSKVTPVFEGNDKPYGIFSGTPNGCVDVIPTENGDFNEYRALIFAGYNVMNVEISMRLEKFLNSGGMLLCSWPHFSDTTNYDDILNYKLSIRESIVTKSLSKGEPAFICDTFWGKEIIVCKNTPDNTEVIRESDSGIPFVYWIKFEKGKILFVNTLMYPGNEAILPVYTDAVRLLAKEVLKTETVRVECSEDVQYTVFVQDDETKHIYLTAVDWYNDSPQSRKAVISLGSDSYEVSVPFGEITKIVTDGKTAVWPESDEAEIVSLSDSYVEVQGAQLQKFFVAKDGEIKNIEVEFDKQNYKKVRMI